MKTKLFFAFILALSTAAIAQVSVPSFSGGVIPGADGKTICESTTHVLSICPSFQVTYTSADVLTVGGIPVNTLSMSGGLILVGGTSYQDGNYLTKMTSGTLTLTPYVPPSSPSTLAFYPVMVPAVAAGKVQVGIYTLGRFTSAAQAVGASPVMTVAPSTDTSLGHTALASVSVFNGYLYVTVINYGAQQAPAQTWIVAVVGK